MRMRVRLLIGYYAFAVPAGQADGNDARVADRLSYARNEHLKPRI